jgi:hypothetical protein
LNNDYQPILKVDAATDVATNSFSFWSAPSIALSSNVTVYTLQALTSVNNGPSGVGNTLGWLYWFWSWR